MQPEYTEKFLLSSWFYSSPVKKMHKNGNGTYMPNNLHFASTKFLASNHPNIYIGSCSQVDEHGYVSLSMGNTYERRMIDAADIVILEMNPNFPRTFGDVELHHSLVDHFIKVDYDVPELPSPELDEKDFIIGKYIADLIEDGSTLQLGIGGIPNAVARQLYNKKDLGVHTEMLTSEIAKLAKAGVVTGQQKSLHRGKIVTTFILGNKELYDFVNNNPAVMVMDGHYTNHPQVIAQNDKQISINSAIEVDLTGQCASESMGSTQFSGTGGQVDTVRGSQDSMGGKSFIALSSTYMAKNPETGEKEEKSKIVAQLAQGSIVSLQRNDIDYVVTEYGAVQLKGKNILERVKLLISIAHPDFREQLLQDAIDYNIIGENHELLLNGKTIYYEIHGEGDPLLMLNGIMMTTKSWAPFIEELSQHHQLILLDFIDQGQSGPAETAYKQDIQVDVIKALLDHLELESVLLFGISYGGEVALQFVSTYPENVEKLLLFNTCAETNYWLEEIGKSWIEAMHSPIGFYLSTIPIIYSPNFFNSKRQWMENRKQVLVELFASTEYLARMKRLIESAEGYNVKEKLNQIACPTLIVAAELDMVTPLDQQVYLHKQIPLSNFHVIPGSGHASMYEKPDEFLSLLLGFTSREKTQIII